MISPTEPLRNPQQPLYPTASIFSHYHLLLARSGCCCKVMNLREEYEKPFDRSRKGGRGSGDAELRLRSIYVQYGCKIWCVPLDSDIRNTRTWRLMLRGLFHLTNHDVWTKTMDLETQSQSLLVLNNIENPREGCTETIRLKLVLSSS